MEEAQKQLAENGRKFESLKASAATWKSAIDANEARIKERESHVSEIDACAGQEPVLHTERDVAWTIDGFAHTKSIKVVTTSNVKLQLLSLIHI